MTQRKIAFAAQQPAFLRAQDIAFEMQVSQAKAYNLMLEMEAKGLTVRLGRSHRVQRDVWEAFKGKREPGALLVLPGGKE